MKQRSPIAVALLGIFVPFYIFFWYISTAREMRARGAQIPTSWLIIVPFVNIWWMYTYSQAVEKVTNGKTSGMLAFLALWLLGSIGAAIIQDSFNGLGEAAQPGTGALASDAVVSSPPASPIQGDQAMPAAPIAAPVVAAPIQTTSPATPPTTPPTGPVGS